MCFFKITLLGIVSFLLAQSGMAQPNTEWVWRPEYTYLGSVSDRLIYSAKLSLFNSVDHFNDRAAILNVQPQALLSYRFIPHIRIGGGIVYRWSTPDDVNEPYYEFRTTQEVGSISYRAIRRIAHRLRAEQRFRSTSYINRMRYRIRYNLPLEGQILKPGDHYLIFSNELMSVFNKNDTNAENRLSTGMGWFYNRYRKFELTLEYRTRDILNNDGVVHLFMMKTSLFTIR